MTKTIQTSSNFYLKKKSEAEGRDVILFDRLFRWQLVFLRENKSQSNFEMTWIPLKEA